MNPYVTGAAVKQLREKRNLTQAELADKIGVSAKTVSKWETGKGLPDISLLEPLAKALNISVIELMNGEQITNRNVSANLLRSKFYVCPLCGNILHRGRVRKVVLDEFAYSLGSDSDLLRGFRSRSVR